MNLFSFIPTLPPSGTRSLFYFSSFTLLFLSLLKGEDPTIPQATTVDRYQAIWTRSPFTAASVTDADKTSGTWILTGLAGSKDSPILFVENKENQERMTVTKETKDNGLQILSFNPQTDLYQSTARLQISGQEVNVQFDKEAIASSAPAPMFTPQPMQPMQPFGQNRMPNPFLNLPMGTPGHPIHRIMIPAPPSNPPPGNGANPFQPGSLPAPTK